MNKLGEFKMKNIYIVNYENLDCYSTARKAIEKAKEQFSDFSIPLDYPYIKNIKEYKTEELITMLNREGSIQFYDGSEMMKIEKEIVQ